MPLSEQLLDFGVTLTVTDMEVEQNAQFIHAQHQEMKVVVEFTYIQLIIIEIVRYSTEKQDIYMR